MRLARSHGYSRKELNKIEKIITENLQDLLDSWNEFFDN